MIEGLLITKLSVKNPFVGKWETIVDNVAEVFRLPQMEKSELKGSKIAKLIAAIPFLAGCKDPDRIAHTNITTYILTKKTSGIFNSGTTNDSDILRRLNIFKIFVGGDKDIIEKGLNLLALAMICEYNRTLEDDYELGNHNPILSGAIDFEKERERLINKIELVKCPYMDEILNSFEAQILWW